MSYSRSIDNPKLLDNDDEMINLNSLLPNELINSVTQRDLSSIIKSSPSTSQSDVKQQEKKRTNIFMKSISTPLLLGNIDNDFSNNSIVKNTQITGTLFNKSRTLSSSSSSDSVS